MAFAICSPSPLLKTSPPTNRTGSRKCLNTNLLLLFLPIFFTNSLVGAKSQLSLLKLKFVFQAQAENWTFYYSDTFNHYGGKGYKKVSFFSDKFVWFSKWWSVSVTRWYLFFLKSCLLQNTGYTNLWLLRTRESHHYAGAKTCFVQQWGNETFFATCRAVERHLPRKKLFFSKRAARASPLLQICSKSKSE